jgi:hypothetical protein
MEESNLSILDQWKRERESKKTLDLTNIARLGREYLQDDEPSWKPSFSTPSILPKLDEPSWKPSFSTPSILPKLDMPPPPLQRDILSSSFQRIGTFDGSGSVRDELGRLTGNKIDHAGNIRDLTGNLVGGIDPIGMELPRPCPLGFPFSAPPPFEPPPHCY